jgi:hypothetical protein
MGATGTGCKVFDVPALDAALSIAGAYSVNGVSMATWIPATVGKYISSPNPHLGGLAEFLRVRLEVEMRPTEKKCASLLGCVPNLVEKENGVTSC